MKNILIFSMCFFGLVAKSQTPTAIAPCSKTHTGSLSVKNETGGDIYFYYATYDLDKYQFVKIKAQATKIIDDISSAEFQWNGRVARTYNWQWKAVRELVENGSRLNDITRGVIGSGSFIITDCGLKQITVE